MPDEALLLHPDWVACFDSKRLNAFHRYGTLHLALGPAALEIDRAHHELLSRQTLGQPPILTDDDRRFFSSDGDALRLHDDWYFVTTPSVLDDDLAVLFHRRDHGRELRVRVSADGLRFFGLLLPSLRPWTPIAEVQSAVGPGWKLVERLLAEGVLIRAPRQPAEVAPEPTARLVAHSCVLLETPSARVIIDPMLVVRARAGFDPLPQLRGPLDAVVITHSHWDHFTLDGLLHLPRTTTILLPAHRHADSLVNVDMGRVVRELGFTDVVELDAWQTWRRHDLAITALPYFGEGFGPESPRDWLTWHADLGGRTVVGLVDACEDDFGTMDDVLPEVRRRFGPTDLFFAPASGFSYPRTHFSRRPFFLTDARDPFTGGPADVARWARQLDARAVVPYALFHTGPEDLDHDDEAAAADPLRTGTLPDLIARLPVAPDGPLWLLAPGDALRLRPDGVTRA